MLKCEREKRKIWEGDESHFNFLLSAFRIQLSVFLKPLHKLGDADGDRRGGRVADGGVELVHIGVGGGNIAILHGAPFHLGIGDADLPGDQGDQVHQFLGTVVADVEEFVTGKGVAENAAADAGDNVVHVGEIAAHVAVIEDLDGLAFEHGVRKQPVGHIRAPPGSVDREEPESHGLHAVQVAVAMGHQLIGFFGCSIEADRGIHALIFGEGKLGIAAIDGGG